MAKTETAPVEGNVAGESKAEKFKRIGASRTEKALMAIGNIGGIANKTNYEYTEAQVQTILKALEAEVMKLAKRFENPNAEKTGGFTL